MGVITSYSIHYTKLYEKRFHLILSREPYELYPNVFFLGSVPRITDFEALTTKFETEGYELDFVPDVV